MDLFYSSLLLGPEEAELRFRLRLRFFCLCLVVSRADAHASWRARNSVTFSTMAHSDKQISRQISTIVFSSALVETLLIQLGNMALYVLFGSYKKNRTNTASRSMLFSNAEGASVCFDAESTAVFDQ